MASAGNTERRSRKYFQQLRGKDLARSPVLEPYHPVSISVELPEPKVDLLGHNATGVVTLEAQPRDVGFLVVMTLICSLLRSRDPEGDAKALVEAHQVTALKLPSPPGQGALLDRVELVAVSDRRVIKPVRLVERHFGGVISDSARHDGDGHPCPVIDGFLARDDQHRVGAESSYLRVEDVASVDRGHVSPPARSPPRRRVGWRRHGDLSVALGAQPICQQPETDACETLVLRHVSIGATIRRGDLLLGAPLVKQPPERSLNGGGSAAEGAVRNGVVERGQLLIG
ncbi:MAG: hypothetical protein ACR2NV_08110 [Thermoleophilaceae bacterium]